MMIHDNVEKAKNNDDHTCTISTVRSTLEYTKTDPGCETAITATTYNYCKMLHPSTEYDETTSTFSNMELYDGSRT